MSDTVERLPVSASVYERKMKAEVTVVWTEEAEREFRRELRKLDVETAVFDHDTKWTEGD